MLNEYKLSENLQKSSANKRDLQRESTRRLLVEGGLRVVADSGFAGTSTAAIAKATGKAHGTVFLHFPTRDDLVVELVAEIGRTISARLSRPASQTSSLVEVMSAHLAALGENEVLYSRLLSEASTLPLAARAYIFAFQSGIASRLKDAYSYERAEGRLREVDPIMFANIWISLTNHYLIHRDFFAPAAMVIAACGEEMKSQVLQLVRTGEEE